MFKWSLLLMIFLSSQRIVAQDNKLTETIRGVVVDEQSGSPLANVSVTIDGVNVQVAGLTDSLGAFKLSHVPVGRQTLRATCVGYEEIVLRNIEVTSSREVILELRMREKIKKLEEFVVTAEREKNRPLNK